MNELISIIVPIYNVEQYLDKCIKSILNQTYENIEVILVNDGSTDNSKCICEKYLQKDNRIKLLNKENGGLSDARNEGKRISNGEYIMFIDGDDYIDHIMTETLYKTLEKDDSDMVVCAYQLVYEEGYPQRREIKELMNEVLDKKEALLRLLNDKYGYYVIAWNKLYKRSIIENIKYPKGRKHEDEFVAHHIYYNCKKISFINNELYYYMQRKDSIMNSKISISRLDAVDAMIDKLEFYISKNITENVYCIFRAMFSVFGEVYLDKEIKNEEKEHIKNYKNKIVNEIKKQKNYLPLGDRIKFYLFVINTRIFYFARKIFDKVKKVQ